MQYSYNRWPAIILLIVSLFCLFFILLGTRPLFVPDEGRYAEIAREMIVSESYITPYLNGIKYFEKPILYYWLLVAAIKIGGLNLWAIRSVNAILALLGCLATYITTRKIYEERTAFLAIGILATNMLYFTMAHMVTLDMGVTVFISICLYAFLLGCSFQNRLYFLVSAIAASLAVLTKGLIGIVFPVMISIVWLLVFNQWRVLKNVPFFFCIGLFMLLTLPWHILIAINNPEFTYFYFINQHFLRYATLSIGHYQPVWFFFPVILIGYFPWIFFLPFSFFIIQWKKFYQYRIEGFFLLWISLIFIFFSFSHSKLIPYILPIFPALSILTARGIITALDNSMDKRIVRIAQFLYLCLLIFSCIMIYQLRLFVLNNTFPHQQQAENFFILIAILLLGSAIIANVLALKEKLLAAISATVVSTGLLLLLLLNAIPAIETRTIFPLANQLKLYLKPDDQVITYNQYYQDLPFYLERTVGILNWRNELEFGSLHQSGTEQKLLNDSAFWQAFHSQNRVFVLISQEELQKLQKSNPNESLYNLASTSKNVLIANQPVKLAEK